MININNVFVKYGDCMFFDWVNLVIVEWDKVGLVGWNGVGKFILFKIIVGYMLLYDGNVDWLFGSMLGFLY